MKEKIKNQLVGMLKVLNYVCTKDIPEFKTSVLVNINKDNIYLHSCIEVENFFDNLDITINEYSYYFYQDKEIYTITVYINQ